MAYHSVLRDIMKDYEKRRDRGQALRSQRLEQMYAAAPRLREIDEELQLTGLGLARLIIGGKPHEAEALRAANAKLRSEKEAVISRMGLPTSFPDSDGIFACKKCGDTGYISGKMCACLKQELVEKYYDLSNAKNAIKSENFDTFELKYYGKQIIPSEGVSPLERIKTIHKTCVDFVAMFGEEFTNLLLYGESGLGKTFLCNCIAKELLDRGKTVLYVTAPQIFKAIEDYRFNRDAMTAPDETIEALTEVELLIIDDLGTEFPTVLTASELFNVINTRLLQQRATVISTNLTLTDLQNQYTERILSRVFGYYKRLKFIGEDIRTAKKYRFSAGQ